MGGTRTRSILLVTAALTALFVLGPVAPASAHATLVDSDPAEGAVLPTQPDAITFTFTESVTAVPGGVRVYDATGETVASSATTDGSVLSVRLEEEVGEGTLIVAWRVVSGDGHPISGALVFSVGEPSAQIIALPPDSTGPSWLLSLNQWLGYLSLLTTAGLVVFLALILPAGRGTERARARLVRAARYGALATAATWILNLPLTAWYQFGGGPGILADADIRAALATPVYAVSAAVVLGTALAVWLIRDGRRGGPRPFLALAAALVALAAPAFTGHTRAATPELLVIGADILHLFAGGVWLGGLVALVLVLPDLAGRPGTLAADVLTRFSTAAAGVLVVLVVAGTVLAWRIAGSWDVLFGTAYGWLLLSKIAVALVVVGIAAANRFILLPQITEATRRKDQRGAASVLARYIAAEVAALVVVLLITGFLVERSPQRDASPVGSGATVVETVYLGDVEARATLKPALEGPVKVEVELFDSAGEPTEGMDTPKLWLSSGDIDLGEVELTSVAPGAYSATVVLSAAGTWQAELALQVGESETPVAVAEFEIGSR